MDAIISDCGRYRYRLERKIAEQGLKIAWFGVNPSRADASLDDATIRKMVAFSKALGGKQLIVGNLIPFRTHDVRKIKQVDEDAWKLNWQHNQQIINDADILIPCWGRLAKLRVDLRVSYVVTRTQILESGKHALCLGRTKCGHPRHPLMLAYSTPFERYR